MKIIIALAVAVSLNLFSSSVFSKHDTPLCMDPDYSTATKDTRGCYDEHDDSGDYLVGLLALAAVYAMIPSNDSNSFANRQLASFSSGNGFVLKETKYFSIHAYEISKLNDTELNNDFDRLNYNAQRVNLLKFKVKL